jgi:hypothetical protein
VRDFFGGGEQLKKVGGGGGECSFWLLAVSCCVAKMEQGK